MAAVLERAECEPLPAEASDYDSDEVKRLVAICYQLSLADKKHRRFFLSSHHAARILSVPQMQVFRWLEMLCKDGVLIVTTRGNARKATRYAWAHKPKRRAKA
jgi:hypothetical protein